MIRRRRSTRGAPALRPRLAGGGLAIAAAVVVAGILWGGASAQAADPGHRVADQDATPAGTTTAVVTAAGRTLTVAVSPKDGLPPSGAQLTVAGTGFDPSHDLWIAVCEDDGVAPAALLHCVGGAIPDENASTGWGIVTDAQQSPYAGPVTTKWHKDGSFKLTLQLPSAMSEDADCVSASCSVYTRSSDDSDRSEDVRVPVGFLTPASASASAGSSAEGSASEVTTSSPTSSAEPTTETIGAVPTTVSPEIMLQTSATAGSKQTVLFAGFTPGEKVDVTLYSTAVKLPTATADPTGNVRITFTVPKNLEAGEHVLQAIGRESRRVGIARFTVGAAPTGTVSASASETSAAASSVTESAAVSASQGALESPAPSSAGSQVVSSAPPSTAVASPSVTESAATASSSVAAAAGDGDGNRLLWLWIVLVVLIVVGGAAGIVAMVRHRRDVEDEPPLTAVSTAPVPGWSGGGDTPPDPTVAGPTVAGPTPGSVDPGGYGLLSGRGHPDGPVLYSGGDWPDRPTSVIGDQPEQTGALDAPTQQWQPGFASPASPGTPPSPTQPTAPSAEQTSPAGGDATGDTGPGTQQWRPDFAAQEPTVGDTGQQPPTDEQPGSDHPDGPDDAGSGGRHRSG